MLQSKFSFKSILPIVILIPLTTLSAIFIKDHPSLLDNNLGTMYFVPLVFSFLWMVFGEMRTKAIKVIVDDKQVSSCSFFGLGPIKQFYFSEIEGFKTSILPSQGTSYEYLYLIINGKKVMKISEFYHKNYQELKEAIELKTKDLGYEDFNFFREVKEIFERR
jgi:hypothetical protein